MSEWVNVSASACEYKLNVSVSACECVRVQVIASAFVCVYELVIALTQDKTMREMFELCKVMLFFLHNELLFDVMAYPLTSQCTSGRTFYIVIYFLM